GREGRQIEIDRLDPASGAHGYRFHSAEVAPAGTAVFPGIGIQNLAPDPAGRYADQEIGARNRREIAYHEQRSTLTRRLAQERDDADFRTVEVHPFESVGGKIDLVQRRFAAVNPVQVAHQVLYTGVFRQIGNPPLELALVRPFAPLPEFAAHEQQLLAGMRPHVAVKGAQVGELWPVVARHLAHQRSL